LGLALGCAKCGDISTTVVVEFSATQVYIDLCDEHTQELLEGARPLGDRLASVDGGAAPQEFVRTVTRDRGPNLDQSLRRPSMQPGR
jgi:hypothetical protein